MARHKMCYAGCKCSKCEAQRETDRQYAKNRKGKFKSQEARAQRARRYGITVDDILAMELAQKNRCAICGNEETALDNRQRVKSLAVDHDHETGKVRGLLCNNCNRAIGLLGDDVGVLLNAVEYLRNGGVKY